MIKRGFFFLFYFTICTLSFAQNPRERLKAVKVSFITEQVELTPKEAEKFWPIYNLYDDALIAIRQKEGKEVLVNYLFLDELTDEEAGEVLLKYLEIEKTRFSERQKLIENLAGVLSNKKIIKLVKAERDFNKEMISRFKERLGNRD